MLAMTPRDEGPSAVPSGSGNSEKRRYTAPKLERLGTIGELTQGLGMDGTLDSQHPPGQNKSTL
jgi:hypothetical protein